MPAPASQEAENLSRFIEAVEVFNRRTTMHYINPRQASTEAASPIRERSYEAESSRLSDSLNRLYHELQVLESDLTPALEPAPDTAEGPSESRARPPVAPLVDTLETYAAMANSMAERVSALRSRLCFS